MGRRRRDKKRTTVGRDLFGRKLIETEYVPAGGSKGLVVCGLIFWGVILCLSGC